jgi:hypothetical protein
MTTAERLGPYGNSQATAQVPDATRRAYDYLRGRAPQRGALEVYRAAWQIGAEHIRSGLSACNDSEPYSASASSTLRRVKVPTRAIIEQIT